MNAAYITALGKFLPGDPIANDEMEDYLGKIHGKSSKIRERILKQNGIRARYYALDKSQRSLFSNAEMAANAVRDAFDRLDGGQGQVDYLAAATSQGDFPLPGFASMVHGELGLPACEIATFHGVCASSMAALKSCVLQTIAGGKKRAVVCGSEFASRLFKASRFEAQLETEGLPFDTEFLRWMLSDGAAAAIIEPQASSRGLSFRIEWIELISRAGERDVCMYVGPIRDEQGKIPFSWLDYPSYHQAADAGALNLRQDVRQLRDVVAHTVEGVRELTRQGRLNPLDLDWLVAHYSSDLLREEAFALAKKAGINIDSERWFSNLQTKGNVGSASMFLMLEELLNENRVKSGEKLLCIVPESGRYTFAYMLMTVVGEVPAGEEKPQAQESVEANNGAPFQAPTLLTTADGLVGELVQKLGTVWFDFDRKLRNVPIVAKLYTGEFTIEDYQRLLFNLRQQVIDGSRWISRAASSIEARYFPLRSAFISHTSEEHRDYEMLDRNYASVGGDVTALSSGRKNIGSEALSAFILHRASQDNPFDLFGAMFIIEGLGQRVAKSWGEMIRDQLSLNDEQVSFFLYHSESDVEHFKRLDLILESGILTPELVCETVRTAKVVARLYLLQLEELDNV